MYHLLCQFTDHPLKFANTETMNQTVLSVQMLCEDHDILFGMPDTYWESDRVFPNLLNCLDDGADLAVALFDTRPEQRESLGMVRNLPEPGEEFDTFPWVVDKPDHSTLHWAWGALAWKPVFWDYILPDHPHVGYGINPALVAGLDVQFVQNTGAYWDCGTFEEYSNLCAQFQEVMV